jgi:hypothetical protein
MAQRKFAASCRVPQPSPSRGKDGACLSALGGYPSKELFRVRLFKRQPKDFVISSDPKLRKTTQVCVRKGVEMGTWLGFFEPDRRWRTDQVGLGLRNKIGRLLLLRLATCFLALRPKFLSCLAVQAFGIGLIGAGFRNRFLLVLTRLGR